MITFICLLIFTIIVCGWEFVLVMTFVAVPLGLLAKIYLQSVLDSHENWEKYIIDDGVRAIAKKINELKGTDEFYLDYTGVCLSTCSEIPVIVGIGTEEPEFHLLNEPTGYLFILRTTDKYGLGWYAPYDEEPTFAYDKKWNCYQYKDFDIVDELKRFVSSLKH